MQNSNKYVQDKQKYLNDFYKLIKYLKSNASNIKNISPILPLIFNLSGKPYNLSKHFVFEPYFNLDLPTYMTWKTGRQVSKSTSSAAHSIIVGALSPYYNILHVTPLFEQMKKFSGTYVKNFINESPLKSWLITATSTRIEQVPLASGSNLYFSFASMDCTRIRGINASSIHYDEIQDMSPEFIPEINSCTAAAENPTFTFTGTPKTLDNVIEGNWLISSQAEWCIVCEHCKHVNIPSLENDLEAMVGPKIPKWTISPDTPGLVCSKCGKWLHTENGRWIHKYPERRYHHAGYHVPQCIMPFHNTDAAKWQTILSRREGSENFTYAKWLNECMGESYDEGQKIITITDLKKAATLPSRKNIENVTKYIKQKKYISSIIGVDWGGYSIGSQSFTKIAVVCYRGDGVIEVPFGWKSLTPTQPAIEAARIKQLCTLFDIPFIAHDFCGAGAMREICLTELGIPEENVIPILYTGIDQGPMWSKKTNDDPAIAVRSYYRLQKAKAIALVCSAIKSGQILFFEYDYESPENPGLLYDFVSLREETVDSSTRSETYRIVRSSKSLSDDFVHAVTYGACALYSRHRKYPTMLNYGKEGITPDMLNIAFNASVFND